MKISTRVIAPLAATGLLAAGLGGAAALDSASATHSSPAAATMHTWKFVAIETGTHSLGKTTFAGTDKDRKMGKIIGYDTISGKYNVRTHVVSIDFAVARKGGLLLGHLKGTQRAGFTGVVTGGTGRYQGATGSASAQPVPHSKKTLLTIKWTK